MKKKFGDWGLDTRAPSPWGFVDHALPFLLNARQRFEQEAGQPLRYGFYVRADAQVEEIYGRPHWALEAFHHELEQLAAGGDEVGLHTHNWRWDPRHQRFYQEAQDMVWVRECLATGLESFRRVMGTYPFAYHADHVDNQSVRLLDDAGVKVAVAPVPGVRFRGIKVQGGTRVYFFDWRRAPNHAYFPSGRDCQRPGPDAAGVLLVPNTIVRQPLGSYLFHLSPIRNPRRLPPWWRKEEIYGYPDHSQPAEGTWQIGRTRLYLPKLERSYYNVPPTALPFLVKKGVETAVRHCPTWRQVPYTTTLRTDDLLAPDAQQRFEQNLRLLVEEARRHELTTQFVNARELYTAIVEELGKAGDSAA